MDIDSDMQRQQPRQPRRPQPPSRDRRRQCGPLVSVTATEQRPILSTLWRSREHYRTSLQRTPRVPDSEGWSSPSGFAWFTSGCPLLSAVCHASIILAKKVDLRVSKDQGHVIWTQNDRNPKTRPSHSAYMEPFVRPQKRSYYPEYGGFHKQGAPKWDSQFMETPLYVFSHWSPPARQRPPAGRSPSILGR